MNPKRLKRLQYPSRPPRDLFSPISLTILQYMGVMIVPLNLIILPSSSDPIGPTSFRILPYEIYLLGSINSTILHYLSDNIELISFMVWPNLEHFCWLINLDQFFRISSIFELQLNFRIKTDFWKLDWLLICNKFNLQQLIVVLGHFTPFISAYLTGFKWHCTLKSQLLLTKAFFRQNILFWIEIFFS